MTDCCEPRFWKGDKLCWPDGPSGSRDVTVRDGPFRVENLREHCSDWGEQAVYLCELPDKTSFLIGETKLRSLWNPCPGEHREARDGGWEKLT